LDVGEKEQIASVLVRPGLTPSKAFSAHARVLDQWIDQVGEEVTLEMEMNETAVHHLFVSVVLVVSVAAAVVAAG
jgi:hypothetical protein